MVQRALALFALSALVSIMVTLQPANSAKSLSVHSYNANADGFLSNSHIVTDGMESILIDAQFSAQEGTNVARIVKSGEQRLSKIVITHPHPDHYYGLEVLGAEFPDAQIIAGPVTIAELNASISYWVENRADKSGFAQTTVFEHDEFNIGQTRIIHRIYHSGESAENTVLYIPDQQMLFVGDLASNGVHMWLAEGHLDNWLEQLDFIRSLGSIKTIYPGHGPVGGSILLDKAEDYIVNFKDAIETSESQAQAIRKMTMLYPDYQLPEILEGSIRAVMSSN